MTKKPSAPAPKEKKICQFCHLPATKLRFKPRKYPMAYDLCDLCAREHESTWMQMGGTK